MTLKLILILLLGLALIVFGAEWLVEGASSIARKVGISEFVIGLTIVGFGTSCPELVVSLTGALQGNADISVGNVVGSNIFNTLLILGITALLAPISVTSENRRRDMPLNVLVTFLLVLCGMNHTILHLGLSDSMSRVEGIVFLLIFCLYIYYCFKSGKQNPEVSDNEDSGKKSGLVKSIVLVLAGLAGLIFGGRFFVNSATGLARLMGVSDKFIAITILAGGTSLPELATCIVAAAKHKDQLALGNILGSNVFNILLILGTSAVITPLSFSAMTLVDTLALIISAVLVWVFTYTGQKDRIDRWEGAILLVCYAMYMYWLFIKL